MTTYNASGSVAPINQGATIDTQILKNHLKTQCNKILTNDGALNKKIKKDKKCLPISLGTINKHMSNALHSVYPTPLPTIFPVSSVLSRDNTLCLQCTVFPHCLLWHLHDQ